MTDNAPLRSPDRARLWLGRETGHSYSPPPAPTVEDILAEARQRMATAQPREKLSPGQRRALLRMNRLVFWLSKHWLALLNVLAGLYAGGVLLAPVLMYTGHPESATALYHFYRPFCHQYPFRSWFLFGARFAYPGELLPESLRQLSSFVGDATWGYKLAFCQRCTATYMLILLAGLLYGVLRRRRQIPLLPPWVYFAFGLLPMALDGGYQWLTHVIAWFWPHRAMLYESTPLLRAITGGLFGLTTVAFAYPYLNELFEETKDLLTSRYHWA